MASATIEHSRPQASIYFETTAAVEKDAFEVVNKLFALSASACYWIIISSRTNPSRLPIKAPPPSDMPMPLIPDIALFQRKLATLPLATYQAGETVLSAASTTG